MQIALTGATGFVGRYLARHLVAAGHRLRCWRRANSDTSGFEAIEASIEWVEGELGDVAAGKTLLQGCDAVVHSALYHVSRGFERSEGDVVPFVQKNVVGTIQLMETARLAGIGRFVFISTCAVYDKILPDRPLDETHPLWPRSHYGAHKAALEKFVHSYAADWNYPICALRPTGVYGLAHPPRESKWFDLVQQVVRGEAVTCERGGKEVHARDVAQAVGLLLAAPRERIAGEAFNCCDLYVSQWDVAHLAKRLSDSHSEIRGQQTTPKNQIVTKKLQALGMTFGGKQLLEETIGELVEAARK